ncbi:MAG: fumarylacetoacetate hydrolase family protein [Nitrospinaceae bacterium]|nr:fumarylacetoacetate hydrolase family protein [Nitrospinaceae bacterium]
MTRYAVPPMKIPAIEVADSTDLFPVHRIYCVGCNYAEHVREMGSDPDREPPFFFMKPSSAILSSHADFPYPSKSENVHFEVELVVAIGKGGKNISQSDANNHVFGYACGLDMTRRDLQGEMKKKSRPWEISKAFEASAPCGEICPASKIGHPSAGTIWLKVNGEIKQEGNISNLIWNIPEIIEHLSGLFELRPGDLIFTGTPAGVGPIVTGDVMEGHIDGVGTITTNVV